MGDTEARVVKYKAWLKNILESTETASMEFLMYQRTEVNYGLSRKAVLNLLKEMADFGVLEVKDNHVVSKIYKN